MNRNECKECKVRDLDNHCGDCFLSEAFEDNFSQGEADQREQDEYFSREGFLK